MMGSKEQLFEQEQQMSLIKLRYREAQDEIDELRNQLGDQTAQVDDYRNKVDKTDKNTEVCKSIFFTIKPRMFRSIYKLSNR